MASADDSSSGPRTPGDRQFTIASIYKCLAPCKECTGNYISEILQKRFVCCCKCHYQITKNLTDSAISNLAER